MASDALMPNSTELREIIERLDATGDEKRCRWPDCDCYSPQGPHACRRALEQKP